MASSAHPPFGSRSAYASGKLPDRSLSANPLPFSASAFSRHRGLGVSNAGAGDSAQQSQQQQQQPPPPPAHSQGHAPSSQEATNNPLNRLTEEQREEINEAVRIFTLKVGGDMKLTTENFLI
jgi:hypothetical protein